MLFPRKDRKELLLNQREGRKKGYMYVLFPIYGWVWCEYYYSE